MATLRDEDAAQLALAKVRQAKIKKMYDDAIAPGTTINGIGPLSLVIDPYFVSYFRHLHGDRIMEDDEFIKFLKKQGDWFGVRQAATKTQVGYKGS